MKSCIVIAFTGRGLALEETLISKMTDAGWNVQAFFKSRQTRPEKASSVAVIGPEVSLADWARTVIPDAEQIVFIGATGIAVRTMAPFVVSKRTDPAVVVMDEAGQFAISLLSGHLGGANELAETLAKWTGALPVITTATDVNHRIAVDVFAKKNHFLIGDMGLAKEAAARILKDEKLPFGVGSGCTGRIPDVIDKQLIYRPELYPETEGDRGDFWILLPEGRVLHLAPKNLILGIGCKKDTAEEVIERQVRTVMEAYRLPMEAVCMAASIDLKKDEPGLTAFCRKEHLPFQTFSAEELRQVEGDFTPSSFVSSVTGVDNVCERSAVLASGHGTLLIKKQAKNGVTVACAVKEWRMKYE